MTLNEAFERLESLVADAESEMDDSDFIVFIGFICGTGSRLIEEMA